jgi:hypothetical protein
MVAKGTPSVERIHSNRTDHGRECGQRQALHYLTNMASTTASGVARQKRTHIDASHVRQLRQLSLDGVRRVKGDCKLDIDAQGSVISLKVENYLVRCGIRNIEDVRDPGECPGVGICLDIEKTNRFIGWVNCASRSRVSRINIRGR